MNGLTPRQSDLLAYLRDQDSVGGCSPSLSEMARALGLRSKSGVHRLLSGLQERGFVKVMPNRARTVELVERHPLQNVSTNDLITELACRGVFPEPESDRSFEEN